MRNGLSLSLSLSFTTASLITITYRNGRTIHSLLTLHGRTSQQRHGVRHPLLGLLLQVTQSHQVARQTVLHQRSGLSAQSVGVVAVKQRGEGSTGLVAKEVCLAVEVAVIAAFLLAAIQLALDQVSDHYLSGDGMQLEITARLGRVEDLLLNYRGEEVKQGSAPGCELAVNLLSGSAFLHIGGDFLQQEVELRDGLNQAFGDENHSVVLAVFSTGGHHIRDLVHHLQQGHALGSDFLGDHRVVGVRLQSGFQHHMGGGTAEQTDEVVVFGGGAGIGADVADEGRHRTAIGIEANGSLHEVVLEIAGIVARNYHNAGFDAAVEKELSQEGGISSSVGTAHQHQSVKVEFLAGSNHFLVVVLADFIGRTTQQIVTSSITVHGESFFLNLNARSLEQTRSSANESIKLAVLVHLMQIIKQTGDDVMTSRALTTTEHNSHIDRSTLSLSPTGDDEIPHLLGKLHDREFGDVWEVVINQRTINVFKGGVIEKVQLESKFTSYIAYHNLLRVLQAFRVARIVLDTIESKRAKILCRSVSLVNVNVSSLN